jgi:ERCC4-related helicase
MGRTGRKRQGRIVMLQMEGKEETVLFAERFYVGTSVSAFSLESHIGI